jgi:hypothetical protein
VGTLDPKHTFYNKCWYEYSLDYTRKREEKAASKSKVDYFKEIVEKVKTKHFTLTEKLNTLYLCFLSNTAPGAEGGGWNREILGGLGGEDGMEVDGLMSIIDNIK